MWILVVASGRSKRWILVDPSSRPWWNLVVRYRWIPVVDLSVGSWWILVVDPDESMKWLLVDPNGGSG